MISAATIASMLYNALGFNWENIEIGKAKGIELKKKILPILFKSIGSFGLVNRADGNENGLFHIIINPELDQLFWNKLSQDEGYYCIRI